LEDRSAITYGLGNQAPGNSVDPILQYRIIVDLVKIPFFDALIPKSAYLVANSPLTHNGFYSMISLRKREFLSRSYGIIQDCQGRINAAPNQDDSAGFMIAFPILDHTCPKSGKGACKKQMDRPTPHCLK
jgi:hypothetical protein